MRHQWLYALIGLYVGTAIGMLITNHFNWTSFISATIVVVVYFSLKHVRRKITGTPETDERVQKNMRNAALYTLVILIGIGVLVLGLTTTPDQQIPVRYLSVAVLIGLFTLWAVLAIVKRR